MRRPSALRAMSLGQKQSTKAKNILGKVNILILVVTISYIMAISNLLSNIDDIQPQVGWLITFFTSVGLFRLLEFDLHALRYRGVMELAWANCCDNEIAAFSGHTSIAIIRKYAGEALQEIRARSAAEKCGRT